MQSLPGTSFAYLQLILHTNATLKCLHTKKYRTHGGIPYVTVDAKQILTLAQLLQDMMAAAGDRDTHMFVSPQELEARKQYQPKPQNSPVHLGDSPIPNKLHKRKTPYEDRPKADSVDSPSSSSRSHEASGFHQGSPWRQYINVITVLDLGGEVNLARRKNTLQMFHIRNLGKDREREVSSWLHMVHDNIVATVEVFANKGSFYVVNEETLLSLEHIVRSTAFPSAKAVGTITGQVRASL